MGTRDSVEAAFKAILKDKPYRKVTVSEICAAAGVSRKAFYENFDDKEAVVEWLFDKHVMKLMRDFHRVVSLEEAGILKDSNTLRMYQGLYAEREYYINLIGPMRGQDDTFIRVVTNAIYDFNMQHIPRLATPSCEWRLDYTAYYFASSQAMFMQKWISDKMTIPPEQITSLYQNITMPFWDRVIKFQKGASHTYLTTPGTSKYDES